MARTVFLAALPLFILYEGFILLVNTDPAAQVRVGADLWTKQLLAAIGGTGLFALGIPVLLIGVFIFIRERKLKLPFRSDWFGWMIGESALYTVVVALLVSTVVGLIFSAAPDLSTNLLIAPVQDGVESLSTSLMFVLSIGAGLYEELVFRVVLVGGMFWVMKSLFKKTGYGLYHCSNCWRLDIQRSALCGRLWGFIYSCLVLFPFSYLV